MPNMLQRIAIVAAFCLVAVMATPLDDYVNKPDPTYKWELVNSVRGFNFTAYNIKLTSQTWMDPTKVSIYIWTHWLQVCIPDNLPTDIKTALIYIDGGSNQLQGGLGSPPKTMDEFTGLICQTAGTVVALANPKTWLDGEADWFLWKVLRNHCRRPCGLVDLISVVNYRINKLSFQVLKVIFDLGQVPNQPMIFASDPAQAHRTEDAMVAWTWRMFLQDNTTPEWLARLPMTKAVVRAMDTVQAFVQRDYSRKVPTFVVAGASKRGWTTWTTAAVDKRVVAMIPIVMPMGNMTPMINTMYRVYGNWSFALQDYINADVMHYLGTPSFSAMEAIIDPMSYYSRWHTLPKYVIAACGDEFFLPDSTRFFWDKLPHPKILRMAPNAEHSMFTAPAIDVVYGIDTFVQRLIRKMSLPTWDFELTYSNTTASIRAWTTGDYQPSAVYLYKATTLSTTQRDFRLIRCAHKEWQCLNPVLWHSKALPVAPGQTEWTASVSAPSAGWTGFLLEAVFPGGYTTGDPYNPDKWIRVTSSVNVVPDRLPFAPCQTTNSCQPSIPWNP